ncbi:tetraspanin-18-like [Parus major]|nr:tetraspanin-18-like [Parus major]
MGSRTNQGWLWPGLCSPLHRDKHCRVPPPGVSMGVLSCMKYLMFIFNVLVFAGGTCLTGMGVWVATDPAGFQDIVAARAVLSAGAWLLLAVGIALSLLGFLGCCGALRRSRPLLLLFFILVSLVFLAQLVGAILFLVHWKQVLTPSPASAASLCHTMAMAQSPPGDRGWPRDTLPLTSVTSTTHTSKQVQPEHFLSELQKNYGGDESAEVFSTAWNTLMVTVSSWEAPGGHTGSTKGPKDFGNGSRFQELHPGMPWPQACCARDGFLLAGELLGWEQCQDRSPGYIHEQGCFFTFGRTLQRYISLPGTCSLAVLGIEIFAMFFAFCLYYNFD